MPTVLALKEFRETPHRGRRRKQSHQRRRAPTRGQTYPAVHDRPRPWRQYTPNLEPPVETYGRREQHLVAPSVLAGCSELTHRRTNDAEAHPRHHRRPGVLRAALSGGEGAREDGGRRDDDHRPGGRLELQHYERRLRRRS